MQNYLPKRKFSTQTQMQKLSVTIQGWSSEHDIRQNKHQTDSRILPTLNLDTSTIVSKSSWLKEYVSINSTTFWTASSWMNWKYKISSRCSNKIFLQGNCIWDYYKIRATNASYWSSNSATPCYGRLLSNSATELQLLHRFSEQKNNKKE